jgi:hypothetical protein
LARLDVELEPEQPPEIAAAVAGLLQTERAPDSWWQAGIDESLKVREEPPEA